MWTVRGEKIPPSADWATHIVSSLAAICIESLPEDTAAKDWLNYRGLPTSDSEWLADQDLGSIPFASELRLSSIRHRARELYNEQFARESADMADSIKSAKMLGAKAVRAAQADAAVISTRLAEERVSLEHICDYVLPRLERPAWQESVVYVYRDANGTVTSLNIRQYKAEDDTDDVVPAKPLYRGGDDEDEDEEDETQTTKTSKRERKIMRIQPRANRRGLFGVTNGCFNPGVAWGNSAWMPLVVEGEHNLLSLRAKLCAPNLTEYPHYLPCVAVGGKNGADVASLEALCGDARPIVIFDNDRIDERTGRPGGYDLVTAVSQRMYCFTTTTPDGVKDLDDYLTARPAPTIKQLKSDILDEYEEVPQAMDAVRSQVVRLLDQKGFEANVRQSKVTELIAADIRKRATIYNVDGYALLLLAGGDTIPVRKGGRDFEGYMQQYGICRNDWVDACRSTVCREADSEKTPRNSLHSIAHFDGSRLYINCYEGTMIRISPVRVDKDAPYTALIENVINGTDNVLMRRFARSLADDTAAVTPWLMSEDALDGLDVSQGGLKHRPDSLLERYILATAKYEETPDHFKRLMKCWMLSTFFAGAFKSRPVVMFEGPAGGGKSTLAVRFGNILMGASFSTYPAPLTPEKLAELMTGQPYVVLDEWDTAPKAVENYMKCLLTGGKEQRRELYTTSDLVELACDASVAVTTNSSPIKQAGTQRRFITIPITARQREVGDRVYSSTGQHLLPELMKARPAIWIELIADLAACVIGLASTPANTKTSFSMADFGVWVQRIADHEGWSSEAESMFAHIENKQEAASVDALILGSLIPDLLRQKPALQGALLSANAWESHLQEFIGEHDRERKQLVTSRYIGWMLKSHEQTFKRSLGMKTAKNSHTKTKLYSFTLCDAECLQLVRKPSTSDTSRSTDSQATA
jgi:hypothetical protein